MDSIRLTGQLGKEEYVIYSETHGDLVIEIENKDSKESSRLKATTHQFREFSRKLQVVADFMEKKI